MDFRLVTNKPEKPYYKPNLVTQDSETDLCVSDGVQMSIIHVLENRVGLRSYTLKYRRIICHLNSLQMLYYAFVICQKTRKRIKRRLTFFREEPNTFKILDNA